MYNGWTNFPTWLVALHIQNDDTMLYPFRSMAVNYSDSYEMGKMLKENFCNILDTEQQLYQDLMNYVLEEVNWEEIADMLLT